MRTLTIVYNYRYGMEETITAEHTFHILLDAFPQNLYS